MSKLRKILISATVSLSLCAMSTTAMAAADCSGLPSHGELTTALVASVGDNGGFDLNMWGTIVNRDGQVCAVARTGADRGDQWPGSRVISAQKANTANSFSLPGLALSTANLFSAVQPGNSLFGLQHSNPVDTAVAYGGATSQSKNGAKDYGTSNDPMVGHFIGGVNVFGGGLALYDNAGGLLGAIGVSGDTSCADHNIAWRTRDQLGLDHVPAGVATVGDNIIFDIVAGESAGGFGHPTCNGPGNVGGAGDANDVDDNTAVISAHPLG